ncbi:MAG: hypothetical protein PHI76_00485 [Clostridia bacterium]|nr:hypothetical protein [Clostridia bacterium]
MKLKEIIETSLVLLGRSELLETSLFDENISEEITESQQKEIDFLVRCFNLIYKETSADYLPLLYEEKITFKNGQFEFNLLTESILEVYRLYDNNDNNISYKIFSNYIKANANSANIIYSFIPDNLNLDEEVLLFGGKLLPQVLAYGIAREYCLISGEHSEADIWEKRYKDGIKIAMRKKSQIKIKPRRWE